MAEIIECRDCVSKNCHGCNVLTLSQMLDHGKFDSIMDEHHTINPAADVVEVVRCRDCRKRYDINECPMCVLHITAYYEYTADDGFCDRGERRDTDG